MAKKKTKKQKSLLRRTGERLCGAVLIAFCLLVFAAIGFYHSADAGVNMVNGLPVHNYLGKYGAVLADYALTGFGLAAPVFLLIPLIWGYHLLRQREFLHPYSRVFAWILGVNFFAAFLALLPSWMGAFEMGGIIGKFLSRHLLKIGRAHV